MLFIPLVPHGEVEDDTREQAAFSDAQEESGHKKAREILRHA